VLSGIQYFHECESAAKDSRAQGDEIDEGVHHEMTNDTVDDTNNFDLGEGSAAVDVGLSPDWQITNIMERRASGRLAVEVAKRAKIFADDTTKWTINSP
jgi:hypothetical protein